MSSSLEDLVKLFSKFPGLGPRSAKRVVFSLLKNRNQMIPSLLELLNRLRTELVDCENCGNIDVLNPCNICSNVKRAKNKICVVEEVADLWAIEKSQSHDGIYHVLGGVLSAIDGIGPDELNLKNLFEKVKVLEVEEIILATNPTSEGQLTAQFIADQFDKTDVLVTRLAQGLPMGSELDYIDNGTLLASFKSRKKIR